MRLFSSSSERSNKAGKNILISFIARGISILCSLMIVPLTIEFLNPTQYGIWLTISSVVAWIAFFDLGFANGFRNRFAEAKAQDNIPLARTYVSTTYFAMGIIMALLLIFVLLLNTQLDWTTILKTDVTYFEELRKVFNILAIFFCMNMIVGIFSTLTTANQNPGFSSIINAAGQVVSLLVIYLLIRTKPGNLYNLALYYSGIPCIVSLIISVISFCVKPYKEFAPSVKYIKLKYIKDLMSLGIKFFVICVSVLVVFQISNLILMRECGAESVTQYNIAYKYFNVLYSVAIIIITPIWSAFTDAYKKNDIKWIKDILKKYNLLILLVSVAAVILLIISPLVYKIWIKDNVQIPFILSSAMALYIIVLVIGNTYMYMINGIGTISMQLIIYLCFALISWPAITFCTRHLGVYGALIFPTIVYTLQAIFARIQLQKIINGSAKGLWAK